MTITVPATTPVAPTSPRALVVTGTPLAAPAAMHAYARVWAVAGETAMTDAPLQGAPVVGVEGTDLFAGDTGVTGTTITGSDADQARKRRRSRGLLR